MYTEIHASLTNNGVSGIVFKLLPRWNTSDGICRVRVKSLKYKIDTRSPFARHRDNSYVLEALVFKAIITRRWATLEYPATYLHIFQCFKERGI